MIINNQCFHKSQLTQMLIAYRGGLRRLRRDGPNNRPVGSAGSQSGRSSRSTLSLAPWSSSPGSAAAPPCPAACTGRTWLPGGSVPPVREETIKQTIKKYKQPTNRNGNVAQNGTHRTWADPEVFLLHKLDVLINSFISQDLTRRKP